VYCAAHPGAAAAAAARKRTAAATRTVRTAGVQPVQSFCGVDPADVAPRVFTALLQQCVQVIARLDLRYSPGAEGEALVPSQPMDQELFLNLVTFCEAVWPLPDGQAAFARWVPALTAQLVALSMRHPHVSGLYRYVLISICTVGVLMLAFMLLLLL
jgi:predicted deacetylase